MGKLFLIGAGPGDPELITVKGLNHLKQAQVVLYDALVAPELVMKAPENALKIYVGKRAGKHSYTQDKINELILKLSSNHEKIVRLKGGDPIIFGRGHEEMEFALTHGIEVEIIPGISSSIAGPVSENIPLTKRGISDSFWVLAGTTSNEAFSKDISHAAASSATVVILMGIKKLEPLVDVFLKYRNPDEPICLIENCTTSSQKMVIGCLSDIVQVNAMDPVQPPALIVIGPVVHERKKIQMLKENIAGMQHSCVA